MIQLTPELVDVFRRLDTCSVSNAIETFDCRLRNEGFADATVRCLFEDQPPVVGHAVTARIPVRRRRRSATAITIAPTGGTTS